MLDYSQEELQRLGADITTREIYQQPEVWQEAFEHYKAQAADIAAFLKKIEDKHDYIKVIFAGAGSSAYVGDTLTPYLRQIYDERKWNFNAIATTDIVANPLVYLKREVPTVLVSFARSGNSPESVATVDLAKELVDDLYQITITCAAQGKLAQQAQDDEKNLLLLQPEASNDAGFAMTSSFSSMMLTALLVFDRADLAQKEAKVAALLQLSQDVLERVADVQQLVDLDFSRVIYLGAGPFFGLAHEAQLKILELTAGQIATMYESPVGFRHGPKSLINQDTVVLVFGSADAYTKAYDLDLVQEVADDGIVRGLVLLTDREEQLEGVEQVVLSTQEPLEDSYRIFPYIVYAQLFALLSSLKVKNRPDTPSPTGTVNRVVQGVIIHSLGQ